MVCDRCRSAMTTYEDRGQRIPGTRYFVHRRLISECTGCYGVVFIGLDETKAERKARDRFWKLCDRQMKRRMQ